MACRRSLYAIYGRGLCRVKRCCSTMCLMSFLQIFFHLEVNANEAANKATTSISRMFIVQCRVWFTNVRSKLSKNLTLLKVKMNTRRNRPSSVSEATLKCTDTIEGKSRQSQRSNRSIDRGPLHTACSYFITQTARNGLASPRTDNLCSLGYGRKRRRRRRTRNRIALLPR